ncbi:3-methylfumaryl-CoA hydratase [Sphingobium sp. OAS761]|uniref:acyl-CoA dehydrogenase n=1 Tax=Sphingobium sp. OAS761 TaxID=2817901 RepID=UPI00209ED860|nr:acyl-CoA dehydrogenase [Sphingobium sp. OAS761]MCP1471674.1 3-methylfumaryl-CoA hydratase [Sphingobium sp. OAS761]
MSTLPVALDLAAARHARLLAALLDHDDPPWASGVLPPLAHWLMFPPDTRQSELGADGHPRRADDGLPRRMWAGSRICFLAPIPLGSVVERRTEQVAVEDKQGRSGRIRFTTLRHRLSVNGTVCIEEKQDIVHREAADGTMALPAVDVPASVPALARTVMTDPALLFRYSALTFNAHRIHYDLPYARDVEGYPGLVVHGPLIATLLIDQYLRHHPKAPITAFRFRARRPVISGTPLILGFSGATHDGALTAIDCMGGAAMEAMVETA